jgi:hypothetical protein
MRRCSAALLFALFEEIIGPVPAPAEYIDSPSTATSVLAASSTGFDTSPREIQAEVQGVDAAHRKLFLVQSTGQPIEMSVPQGTPIYTSNHQPIDFDALTSSTSVRVRYHPLSVEAMAIQEL